jgi:hypothetical protein
MLTNYIYSLLLAVQRPSKRAATKGSATPVTIDPTMPAMSDEDMEVDRDNSSRSKEKVSITAPISTATLPATAGTSSNRAPPTRSKKGRPGLAPPSAGAGKAR